MAGQDTGLSPDGPEVDSFRRSLMRLLARRASAHVSAGQFEAAKSDLCQVCINIVQLLGQELSGLEEARQEKPYPGLS